MSNLVVQNRDTLIELLSGSKKMISDLLPKHLTPEKMLKMALIAATKTPKLYECTQESLLTAILGAGECGLNITGVDGQAYLVPYMNNRKKVRECQLIIGYQGYLEMVRRTGLVSAINAFVVYEHDEYTVEFGSAPKIIHYPKLTGDRGNPVGAYAVATLKDGSAQLEFMTIGEIDGIRKRSKASNDGPWKTDYTEMAKKTVLRRLCKTLPKSVERDDLSIAMAKDQELDFDKIIEITPEAPPENRVAALEEKIAEPPKEAEPESEPKEEPTAHAANVQGENTKDDSHENLPWDR